MLFETLKDYPQVNIYSVRIEDLSSKLIDKSATHNYMRKIRSHD